MALKAWPRQQLSKGEMLRGPEESSLLASSGAANNCAMQESRTVRREGNDGQHAGRAEPEGVQE